MEIKDYSGNVIFATERDTLVGASFSGINLENANLKGMDVSHANFYGANLLGASFYGATARNTIFITARLSYASFGNADVYGAFFRGAELVGAYLGGANIIIAGQDNRGYLFYATGNDEGINICAVVCAKNEKTAALIHPSFGFTPEDKKEWGSPSLDDPVFYTHLRFTKTWCHYTRVLVVLIGKADDSIASLHPNSALVGSDYIPLFAPQKLSFYHEH